MTLWLWMTSLTGTSQLIYVDKIDSLSLDLSTILEFSWTSKVPKIINFKEESLKRVQSDNEILTDTLWMSEEERKKAYAVHRYTKYLDKLYPWATAEYSLGK